MDFWLSGAIATVLMVTFCHLRDILAGMASSVFWFMFGAVSLGLSNGVDMTNTYSYFALVGFIVAIIMGVVSLGGRTKPAPDETNNRPEPEESQLDALRRKHGFRNWRQ